MTAELGVEQQVHCQVYDLESGWAPTALHVNQAVQAIYPQASVQWREGCDLLEGLHHATNQTLSNDIPHQNLLLFVVSCTCLKGSGNAAKAPGTFFATLLEHLSVGALILFIETQFNVPDAFGDMKTADKKLKFCATLSIFGLAGIFLYRVVENNG